VERVARMGDMRDACKILIGQLELKRLLGWPRCRREDNVRIAIREYGGKVWTGCILLGIRTSCVLALMNMVMHLLGSIKGGEFLD